MTTDDRAEFEAWAARANYVITDKAMCWDVWQEATRRCAQTTKEMEVENARLLAILYQREAETQ